MPTEIPRVRSVGREFPMRHQKVRRGRSKRELQTLFLIAIATLAYPEYLQHVEGSAVSWPWLWRAIGLGLLVWAYAISRARINIAVTPDHVHGYSRGMFGTKTWESPMRDYRGILAEQDSEFTVTLKHKSDPSHDVELFESTAADGWREQIAAYVRLLNKPYLVGMLDDGYVEQSVDDHGKTVVELAEAQGRSAPIAGRLPENSRLSTRRSAEEFVIDLRRRRNFPGGLAGLLFAGVFFWVGSLLDPSEGLETHEMEGVVMIAQIAVFAMGVAGLYMAATNLTSRVAWHLHISNVNVQLGKKTLVSKDITLAEVLGVRDAYVVLIATDADSIRFGEAFSHAEAAFVRDHVVAGILGSSGVAPT